MDGRLEAAIASSRVLAIRYNNGGIRYIEPVAMGFTSTGKLAIRAYQRRGASISGTPRAWKLFEAEAITVQKLLRAKFSPRKGYAPNDSAFVTQMEVLARQTLLGNVSNTLNNFTNFLRGT